MEVLEKKIEDKEYEDIFDKYRTKEFNITNNYEYVKQGPLFKTFSNILYYLIAFPILKIITKVIYDLKIEGKENIRNIRGGAVTVSNHVLVLDCAMVGLACGRKKVYYTALESHFKIPFIRKLIKLLRAIPIPADKKYKAHFIKSLKELLENNCAVHFYPEGSLMPYCSNIRKFKNGAFNIAVNAKVPIVPMVFIFREPKGIRKLLKKKKDVTLKILEPIESMGSIEALKNITYDKMSSSL